MLNLAYNVTMCRAYANDPKGSAPSEETETRVESWDEKLGEMIREADVDGVYQDDGGKVTVTAVVRSGAVSGTSRDLQKCLNMKRSLA